MLLCTCYLSGQNLVINHQFDSLVGVNGGNITIFRDVFYAEHWYSPTGGTPDIYRNQNIAPATNINLSQINTFTQSVYSGDHASGLIFLTHGGYVEHLMGTLTKPLDAGQIYQVTFYLRKEPTNTPSLPLEIGYKFSASKNLFPEAGVIEYGKVDPYYQNLFRDVKICADGSVKSSIPDLDWVKLKGRYVARGGEKYITIGIFATSNDQKDIIAFEKVIDALPNRRKKLVRQNKSRRLLNNYPKDMVVDENTAGYYFLDNVSVVPIDSIVSTTGEYSQFKGSTYHLSPSDCATSIHRSGSSVDKGFVGKLSVNAHIDMLPGHLCTILIDGEEMVTFSSPFSQVWFSFDYSIKLAAKKIRGKQMELIYSDRDSSDFHDYQIYETLEVGKQIVQVFKKQ